MSWLVANVFMVRAFDGSQCVNHICWILNPLVTVLETVPLRKGLRLNEIIRVEPWSDRTNALIRSGRDTWTLSPPCRDTVRGSYLQARQTLTRDQSLSEPWSWTFQLPEWWENTFLYFKPHSLWYFVMAVWVDYYTSIHRYGHSLIHLTRVQDTYNVAITEICAGIEMNMSQFCPVGRWQDK